MLEGEIVRSGDHWYPKPGRVNKIRETEIDDIETILPGVVLNPTAMVATVRSPAARPDGADRAGEFPLKRSCAGDSENGAGGGEFGSTRAKRGSPHRYIECASWEPRDVAARARGCAPN